MKKRIAAVVLAGAMALSLAPAYGVTQVKAEDNLKIAMVTDSGDITDQSFNQTTYEACKECRPGCCRWSKRYRITRIYVCSNYR